MTTRHHRTCTLCEAMCGLVITTDGDRITGIRGDADDPLSRGHLCPKAVALQDVHTDPDRLRQPMRRLGDRWEPIAWDAALRLAVDGLRRVQRAHGRDAVASYVGNPTVHSLGAMLFAPRLVRALRSRNRFSATSVDQLPAHVVALQCFGHALLIPVPDLDRTQHVLMLGANPAASNGSLMTAPGVMDRLAAIRARGGRVVVIDPRRSETAAAADEHHFIRPGTDALFLLGVLHVVMTERLARPGPLESLMTGLDALHALAGRFPPERVAPATGIGADVIRRLARDFAQAPRAVAYGRVGVSMQEFGGLATWLITALNLVTGRVDAEGGAMFTRPAVDILRADQAGSRPRFGRWTSRVRGLPEFAGELPVSALAEEIETPGPGQVRALVTHAGNPVLSTPNGARLDRALAGLEWFVAVDCYLNETTRHAHLILPPTSPLEREHYDLVFHTLAVRDTARWSGAVFPRPPGARHDWEILNALAGALDGTVRGRLEGAVLARLGPRRLVDHGLRTGPYGTGYRPFGGGLTVRALERAPSGVDLGALKPALPGRLRTADRRIHAAPELFLADIARLEARFLAGAPGGEEHPGARPPTADLELIGRRALRSCNSWMHNSERLVRGKRRCTLQMHPDDAARRGLADGASVRITTPRGAVTAELEVTDALMPGVVSLPHGWGHDRPGIRLGVAQAHAGASINDLTDDQRVDALTGNAAFSGVAVTVAAEG
ncbi:MAG: molybdopterin-dependent oxidoreductase [Gemmatimonadaceae bacterium]|nr:molybdopterin-dependent oxidoreductase [Gemmatimonadaceae bacterium]